ncbi:MAG: DUF167 domain-containing protein [Phycisphaerae bacterium]|nr:DUF167 domain-containing protein [Phycisphaerae bacterium]
MTVKVVPGSSRDRISGLLGDALKVQVSAPPERGRANAAVVSLLSNVLGVSARDVAVTRGTISPRKTVFVRGASVEEVASALGLA